MMSHAQSIRALLDAHAKTREEERERDRESARFHYLQEAYLRDEIQTAFTHTSSLHYELQV